MRTFPMLLAAAIALAAPTAWAQHGSAHRHAHEPAKPSGRAESPKPPAQPAAASSGAPKEAYRSPLGGYHGFADPPMVDWKKANDAVREAGGHIGTLKSHAAHEAPVAAGHGAHMKKEPEAPARKP